MLVPSLHERKSWLGFILVCIIGLNLYFDFSFKDDPSDRALKIDQFFGRVFVPIQLLVLHTQESSRNLSLGLSKLIATYKENEILKRRIQESELQMQMFAEVKLENERFRELLGFRGSREHDFLAAEVIGSDPSLYFRSILLDRGESDGVEVGMPVVSPKGVIGRIIEVGRWSSQVLLISDVNSRIDATLQRSRTRAIVAGNLEGNRLQLQFLPRRQDIRVGDSLVTSGLGQNFPPGFRIGTIVEIRENPNEVLEEADVSPAADFDAVEEVFILKSFSPKKG